MRSFIGAFGPLSRCIPGYARYLCELENAIAGKRSAEKIVWNSNLMEHFSSAQTALRNPKAITLPHPSDQLILVSDSCNSSPCRG